MGFLSKLEKLSEKYIEGFFKTKFADHIQPAEIAKLLVREMRDNKNVSVSKVYVPNEYCVLLNNEDFQTIDSVRHSISEELEGFMRQKAAEKGYEMVGEVKVSFEQGKEMPMGTVFVKSSFSEEIPQHDITEEAPVDQAAEYTIIADKERFYNKVNNIQPQDTLTRIGAAVQTIKAQLVQKIGTRDGEKYPLGARGVIIGRRRTSDIRLEDTNVSRIHASIDFFEGSYYITDLGSTNGTYINGIRISKKKLSEGDLIRVGTTVLEFKVV